MFGTGILKGLAVTLKEFVLTYVDDIKKIPSRYAGGREELDQSAASNQTGLFTVQYPEERRKLGERFRLPVATIDERLSSWEAEQRVPAGRHGDPRDAQAAAIILETWFNHQRSTSTED